MGKKSNVWGDLWGSPKPSGLKKAEGKTKPTPKPSDYDANGNLKKKDKGSIAKQIDWPNAN